MRPSYISMAAAVLPVLAAAQDEDWSRNFTTDNGQVLTPGLAVWNSPQPNTPMGGDTLHLSIDVTGSGKFALGPYEDDSPTALHNITIFLSSYHTGRNFTITNGTASEGNFTYGDILAQQPGSTVKHINWVFPDCLVGDGAPGNGDGDRGLYNVSMRQAFRLNDTEYYTIFDLPIALTNRIDEQGNRPDCDALDNGVVEWDAADYEATEAVGIPLAGAGAEQIVVEPKYPEGSEGDENHDGDNGNGKLDTDARPGDVDGAAAALLGRGHAWVVFGVVGAVAFAML